MRMYRNYPLFVGAWKSVYKLDLLRIQDDVKVWNVAILSPVCVWCGCKLKMTFCLNLPLVFMVGCGIILVRKSAENGCKYPLGVYVGKQAFILETDLR